MKSDNKIKTVRGFLKLFSQRTSIRGVPKLENSRFLVIKWFWAFFIIIAHLLMITLLVLLVERYFRFDTTIKISNVKVSAADFPEVTVCSKRFFDLPEAEDPSPFFYLNEYNSKIMLQAADFVRAQSFEKAINLLKTQCTTSLFFYNNFNFIKERTQLLASNLTGACNVTVLDGKKVSKRKFDCSIKAIFNPLYLNCLAFSIPSSFPMKTSTKYKMNIVLNFADRPQEFLIDTFKMDEYLSDFEEDTGYQETRVYISQKSDFPFDFDYEVPFNCNFTNHYIVSKIQENFYFTGGSSSTCRKNEIQANSYGSLYTITREKLCKSLILQKNIFQNCNCFQANLANNNSNFTSTAMCILNEESDKCAEDVYMASQDTLSSLCLPLCTKTSFSVTHKLKAFYSSDFSKKMDVLFQLVDSYRSENGSSTDPIMCCFKDLFPNVPQLICNSSKQIAVNTGNNNPVSSTLSSITNIVPYGNDNGSTCDQISMNIEMRPKMQVNKESLVVEVNTLLSQLGGLCAFFTGLTFTIIAEIIETFIFCIINKMDQN